MYLLLAYDNYYPSPNNIRGIYRFRDDAEKAKERFLAEHRGWYDYVEIEFQEIGDAF